MSKPPLEVLEQRVRQLHSQGLSQTRTAETLGISRYKLRIIATELGIVWDGTQTARATAQRAATSRLDVLDLLERWADVARDELDAYATTDDDALQHGHIVRAGIATDKLATLKRHLGDFTTEAEEIDARDALDEMMNAIRSNVSDRPPSMATSSEERERAE